MGPMGRIKRDVTFRRSLPGGSTSWSDSVQQNAALKAKFAIYDTLLTNVNTMEQNATLRL